MKFIFIAVCSAIALGSYFFCHNKRNWFWLATALGFTLGADFFLILHNRHLPGVAVFCFAHLAYIMRAVSDREQMPEVRRQKLLCFALPAGLAAIALALFWPSIFNMDAIFVVTAIYATLFIINIYVSARYLQYNRKLVITGLLLFAACDICVLLFNLPLYMGAPQWLRGVFPFIWVFYLPAQALLAVSAINFSRKKVR